GVSNPMTLAAMALPMVPEVRIEPRELAGLSSASKPYHAIYVAEGASFTRAPSVLRASDDFAPVVLQFGTAHNDEQWLSLLVAALTGSLRTTDVLIARAARSANALRDTWRHWRERFQVVTPRFECVPNGIDFEDNARDENLRRALRHRLAIEPDVPVF